MTKRQWNEANRLMAQVDNLRTMLKRNDPARDYLYRAGTELETLLSAIVPERE